MRYTFKVEDDQRKPLHMNPTTAVFTKTESKHIFHACGLMFRDHVGFLCATYQKQRVQVVIINHKEIYDAIHRILPLSIAYI